jgi:hypothetical protein
VVKQPKKKPFKENETMDYTANENQESWIQLEIPGLFEQLEKSSDSHSENETETESTQRIEFAATQTKSACAD